MSESTKIKKISKSQKANGESSNMQTVEFNTIVNQVVDKVKNVVKAGNAKKIVIKNHQDDKIAEIPLSIAIFGAILAPYVAALGLLGSVLANYTVIIEKK